MYFGEATINKTDIQPGTTTQISFFGKSIKIEFSKELENDPEEIKNKFNKILNLCCNGKQLYSYIFHLYPKLWKEINEDSYFEKDQKINNTNDLINSIDTKHTFLLNYNKYYKIVYFCGNCWFDDEHGFSFSFPNGDFVKGKDIRSYDITRLGQYSDGL